MAVKDLCTNKRAKMVISPPCSVLQFSTVSEYLSLGLTTR